MIIEKKFLLASFLPALVALFALLVFLPKITYAATLGSVADLISTSRPSASAPITANQAASASQVTVSDNGSVFLASDSATLRLDTGETQNTVTVASMSATNTPASNQRIVYFTSTAANTHHAGDPIVTAISAMHKISFVVPNAVPSTGKIVITFPALTSGDANNAASPSATTFQFNALADANVKLFSNTSAVTFTGAYTAPASGTSPIITLSSLSAAISGGNTVTLWVGCSSATSSSCSTAVPTMINPTTAGTAAGTARIWQVSIVTQDTNSVEIDSAKVKIATVDSVLVQAIVDPTLTVTIAGLSGSANFNSSSSSCTSETANSGIAATATTVNLGTLGSGNINLAGQTITVTTNAQFGYTITATSSGRFIDPSTGVWITDANGGNGLTANDTPVPAVFPASGNPAFGISPCGTRVTSGWTGGSAFAFSSGAKAANPWNTANNSHYATIATYAGPAVTTDVTVVRYAATITTITPAGVYFNVFTYVVTPTF